MFPWLRDIPSHLPCLPCFRDIISSPPSIHFLSLSVRESSLPSTLTFSAHHHHHLYSPSSSSVPSFLSPFWLRRHLHHHHQHIIFTSSICHYCCWCDLILARAKWTRVVQHRFLASGHHRLVVGFDVELLSLSLSLPLSLQLTITIIFFSLLLLTLLLLILQSSTCRCCCMVEVTLFTLFLLLGLSSLLLLHFPPLRLLSVAVRLQLLFQLLDVPSPTVRGAVPSPSSMPEPLLPTLSFNFQVRLMILGWIWY